MNNYSSFRIRLLGVTLTVLAAFLVMVFGATALFGGTSREDIGRVRPQGNALSATAGNPVAVSGTLVFPNRAMLSFDTSGTVGEVLVKEGERVEKGHLLASLNAMAIAKRQKTMAQDRLTLRRAEEALDIVLQSTNPDVAGAEASVADARVSLDQEQEARDNLLSPTSVNRTTAGAAVANAKLALDQAQDSLDALLDTDGVDRAQADVAVANAKLALDQAQEDLDDVKGGYPIADIEDAQNEVTYALTNLANADRSLRVAGIDWENKVTTAEDDFEDATDDYEEVFFKWLGIKLSPAEQGMDPEALFVLWEVDLEALFDPRNSSNIASRPVQDPATRWSELTIWAWLNLYPDRQNILATCEDDEVLLGKSCVEREVDDSWDVYRDASDDLETTRDNSQKALTSASDTVIKAEQDRADVQEDLDELLDGPDAADIESAGTGLALALAKLRDAQEDRNELLGGVDSLEVAKREKAVALARAKLEDAQEDLDDLVRGVESLNVQRQEKQVALAHAKLDAAETHLAAVEESVRMQVALRQAEVGVAREAFAESLEDLEGATIRAPFSGIISLVSVEPDDEVDKDSRAIVIVDPTSVEVGGLVDGIDIAFVAEGAKASVTIDSLPGQVFDGTVSKVADEPRTERGVISYPVSIAIELPEGVEVPLKLTAVSTVILPGQ